VPSYRSELDFAGLSDFSFLATDIANLKTAFLPSGARFQMCIHEKIFAPHFQCPLYILTLEIRNRAVVAARFRSFPLDSVVSGHFFAENSGLTFRQGNPAVVVPPFNVPLYILTTEIQNRAVVAVTFRSFPLDSVVSAHFFAENSGLTFRPGLSFSTIRRVASRDARAKRTADVAVG
jgi:hypothetical protein